MQAFNPPAQAQLIAQAQVCAKMQTPPVLEVAGLNAFHAGAQALFEVSFTAQSGQALVLQGPNGAGKSTCLKALMGMVKRSATRLHITGVDTLGLSVERIADLGVGYVPENRRIFTRLTVQENLRVAARAAAGVWSEAAVLDALPHLKTLLNRQGDAISGGEQRMVAVARALMRQPSLMLLDEPCEGVAPKVADAIESALRLAMGQGAAMVLSESHDGFAQRLGAVTVGLHAGAITANH
jgi:branched-chain amino acid transport system ATP-binding protein